MFTAADFTQKRTTTIIDEVGIGQCRNFDKLGPAIKEELRYRFGQKFRNVSKYDRVTLLRYCINHFGRKGYPEEGTFMFNTTIHKNIIVDLSHATPSQVGCRSFVECCEDAIGGEMRFIDPRILLQDQLIREREREKERERASDEQEQMDESTSEESEEETRFLETCSHVKQSLRKRLRSPKSKKIDIIDKSLSII
ncbi:hypothetical protein NEOLI_000330 [Neolecta irregularis DAH-3]|uniref:Uncharacterized protein n=1 Tax=Neolecta irregularis (strain DAH-3) TaxID=1198029 RepID=A0A1U7LVP8_NEOID|nr:hypothetical protein NEOLI_000330 [Neolecta irregularis DAH-3]|eukprot:OLL26699.1 hypothetical protein NEOLI_000330 [Neolecta irregularis DAH-3]